MVKQTRECNKVTIVSILEPESKMMQLAAKYRDASQVPTPKIYAIDDAFESMRGAGSDQGPVFKGMGVLCWREKNKFLKFREKLAIKHSSNDWRRIRVWLSKLTLLKLDFCKIEILFF